MTDRRRFLGTMLAAATLPQLGWAAAGSPTYLAAAREPGGDFALFGLDEHGARIFRIALPARGHAAAAHPSLAQAVAFARRPGTYALVIDCRHGRVLHRLTPPAGRQFNGHGCYSADGSFLYTSEVVAEGSAGRIGLWDVRQDYARIAEWDSGGIGPHEIRRLPGSDRLIVANGGIETDPDDRSMLNIATMRPNLALIDQGRVLERTELAADLHKNSIRHLALSPDGQVAFAMQWQGDPAETVPLLGIWRPGESPRLCPAGETAAAAMKGYAGSIAFSQDGKQIAITSPRGGVAQVFGADGRFIASLRRIDVCGIAAGKDGFILTDGGGAISRSDGTNLKPLSRAELAWDNHLVPVG